MPKEISWWVWAVTAVLLLIGNLVHPLGHVTAISLSCLQTVFFVVRDKSISAFAVQIRLGYTILLLICYSRYLRWLYWLPTIGTFALIIFGYCLMARLLSLMPWNGREKLSLSLLYRTFISAPAVNNPMHGISTSSCPGGVCSLEMNIAQRPNHVVQSRQGQQGP
jgi:hypothetical protein